MKVELGELQEISMVLVDEPATPIRLAMSDEKMDELVKSMKIIGLIEPIVVMTKGARFEIVAGHRRFIAARKLGWERIRAVVLAKLFEYADIMKLHENLFREDVNPVDECRFLTNLKATLKCDNKKLAAMIGRGDSYISERLSIAEWPSDVLKLLTDGEMVWSVAREFAKIDDDKVRTTWIGFARVQGINPKTAREWRETYERSKLEKEQLPSGEPPATAPTKPEPVYVACSGCGNPSLVEEAVVVRLCNQCNLWAKEAIEGMLHAKT
jgi:ParB/RepB/Spo0J family partition protein